MTNTQWIRRTPWLAVVFTALVLFSPTTRPAAQAPAPLTPPDPFLDQLKGAGVRYVFAGHYHRNAFGRDGDLEMITTGLVGRPLGADPSGIRIVTVKDTGLAHAYYGFGSIPNQFPVPPASQRGAPPPRGGAGSPPPGAR